ncbi:hypothetical protein AVEN_48911-1 [Araneus ventricosus]|uniref:Uncharacterized protein n=1 Tax=Araneus ventricosus TaxID=182803 RepID=A0A4Y2AGF6_ARAVE|nr:hypothetical protein AVEN_48911-1 [Araneus ventricosus]
MATHSPCPLGNLQTRPEFACATPNGALLLSLRRPPLKLNQKREGSLLLPPWQRSARKLSGVEELVKCFPRIGANVPPPEMPKSPVERCAQSWHATKGVVT